MNNGLDKIRIIDAGLLDTEYYFESLIQQAHDRQFLSVSDMERLQYECINLLAYKTERYNAGDSSSIRVEKAQDIMASIAFTIGLWLKTYVNPDDAVTALQREPIKELYTKGRSRIDTMLVSAKETHARLLNRLLNTPNVFYRSTLYHGIKGFFKLYNPDFSAHTIHITADYPAFNRMPELAGIEFLSAYLHRLYCENMFCTMFAAGDIHHLLCGYLENYEEHLINIYEPVLLTALGCLMTETDCRRLSLTKKDVTDLCRLLEGMTQSGLAVMTRNIADRLIRILNCEAEVAGYLYESLPLLLSKIRLAIREQTLDRLFVLPDFPEDRPKLFVSYGEAMDNELYRRIIEEINQCRHFSDKLSIIKTQIHSLADLESVLLDAVLTGDEMTAILQNLSIPEIAVFSKHYMPMTDIDPFSFREQDLHLRKALQNLLHSLPEERQRLIAEAVNAIQEA